TTWGRQLRASGVNMDLAPVLDTVPSPAAASHNPPIGAFRREFGYTTARVGRHGTAFARGMAAARVLVSIKHFPGLGRVRGNTDTSSGVTDTVTRRGDAYLRPFQKAIGSGAVPFVMMSTAYYSHLDKGHPAAFSRFIIGTVLRGDLGFKGAVISDDLANARQVSRWSYGGRAVRFVRAGGDVVLTVNPAALPAMYDAVLARARANAGFRAKVDRAALRVLRTKEAHHLLGH
ncbi:MAG: beta-N-acetylhexosaminidase, partial [Nocardioidaceae bacterium]|nr:beta-N-acetylhexosaminidase [Nocardioidaceae bacterium]